MTQQETNSLIYQSAKGDHSAFGRLIDEYQNYIFRVSFRVLSNEEDACDVVQECFIRVWKNIGRYNTRIKFSTWLYKIAMNLCIDILRKRKNHVEINHPEAFRLTDKSDLREVITNKELAQIIKDLSQHLSPKQKVTFVLRDLEGLEIDEIKEITGMKPTVIKSNLYYARKEIREQLWTKYKVSY